MLEEVDLDRSLSKAEYQRVFPDLQERLRRLQYALLEAEIPTVVVFEGWDASGKGTVIQRLTERLDPRAFRVHPGAPPSELEQRYHFLWRHQLRLPEDGHMVLFDHSWYGRVLVDRVEKWVEAQGLVAGLRADQRVRALARRRRPGAGQVLVPHLAEGAAPPPEADAGGPRGALEGAEGGPAPEPALRPVAGGGRGDAGAHRHPGLPVDGGGGDRPAVDAGEGLRDPGGAHGGGAGPPAAGARKR